MFIRYQLALEESRGVAELVYCWTIEEYYYFHLHDSFDCVMLDYCFNMLCLWFHFRLGHVLLLWVAAFHSGAQTEKKLYMFQACLNVRMLVDQ